MNAREAMQALLDGKTLERDDPWYLIKLDDEGRIVACDSRLLLNCDLGFRDCHTLISDMDRIYEEYPLTFEQALKEMLNGKTVRSEYEVDTLRRFNSGESCFEELSSYGWEHSSTIWRKLQKGKWRVVG
jgi:hypothetical protein